MCKGGCGNKPAIWISSGAHPREKISPAVGTYLLDELVEYNDAHPDLTEKLDWYFLLVHNPDGYRYSMGGCSRKNRSNKDQGGDTCNGGCETSVGVDLERNFNYLWTPSSDTCSLTYPGKSVSSEIETRNVEEFILARKDRIKLYISLHSYSQFILLPTGDDGDDRWRAVKMLADKATMKLNAEES